MRRLLYLENLSGGSRNNPDSLKWAGLIWITHTLLTRNFLANLKINTIYPARAQSARAQRACALRALGLLLADGALLVGRLVVVVVQPAGEARGPKGPAR